MRFIKPGWKKIEGMCRALAKKVLPYKPDWLVGISRGGLVPVRLLSDYLDNRNVAVMRIEFYKTIGETREFPKVSQLLQVDVGGKKVLIVDDVADTGMSLAVAKEHVKRAGAAAVKIAVLHYKPASALRPDFFMESTDAWIIYPWEVKETEEEIRRKKGKR